MPACLSLDDRKLGYLLGLGDLQRDEPCMGYVNACVCSGCLERAERVRELRNLPPQPWELKAA